MASVLKDLIGPNEREVVIIDPSRVKRTAVADWLNLRVGSLKGRNGHSDWISGGFGKSQYVGLEIPANQE